MSLQRMLCFMVLGMSACNGGRSSLSQNPPPTISSAPAISPISPANTTAGGAGFTLTVNGSNFISGANVGWTNPGDPGFVGGPGRCQCLTSYTPGFGCQYRDSRHGAGYSSRSFNNSCAMINAPST